ncbi:hypothetical protein [Methyloligella solikamskensis]|uniref:Sulfotransferase n=1 Tax=Methyloligella solikamskensis TaxID=1177756 RepID=A0ABW3JB27_9HYPH
MATLAELRRKTRHLLSRTVGSIARPSKGNWRSVGPVTDFAIVGFPKCGTTALARFFETNEDVQLAKLNGRYESPYFKVGGRDPGPDYRPGAANGHKFTSYAYSRAALRRLYDSNPELLFVFCVREAKPAMLSWRRMHSLIAERGTPETHPVNRSAESRAFYQSCSAEAYFEAYADERLNYAQLIERFRTALPEARFVVTSQGRLAQDAAGVMTALLSKLGIAPSAGYLAKLPKRHDSYGQRATTELSPELAAALTKKDEELFALIDSLPPEQNLTLRQPEFREREGSPENAL